MVKFKLAQMQNWNERQKENIDLIVLQSIQDFGEIVQKPKAQGGRMPVKLGNLRNSYVAEGIEGADAYILAVGSFEVGGVFTAGWTAKYARRVNNGFTGKDKLGRTYNQAGAFFLEGAVVQWQEIVSKNAEIVRNQ